MFAYSGAAVTQHSFGNLSLLFARQPEPDLDFEEDLAEETQPLGSQNPQSGKSPKKKGTSPLIWVLLILMVGVGGYFAMDPDGAMNMVTALMGGEEPAPQPAPAPRPATPQTAGTPAAPAPPTATPAPTSSLPGSPSPGAAPAPIPPAATKPTPVAAAPAPAPSPASAPIPAPVAASPVGGKSGSPLFGEGQHVTIASLGALTLSQDAMGKVPGPAIKPGAALVVLDGDLQPTGWVYNVQTETGSKGWIPEKLIKAMP